MIQYESDFDRAVRELTETDKSNKTTREAADKKGYWNGISERDN